MKSAAVLVAALAGTAGVANAAGTANYKPDYKAVRALMTDTKFLTLTTPCVAPNSKRFISAEWIRTVFHDAATYDKNTGTGGIDGSIGLELQRPENAGDAIRDSLSQFRAFNQDGVSMADITVLGAIMATLSCGGPEIPFRYGRADTKIPNVDGLTPMPDQPVHVHAGQFKRMGFNATEMIQLVACGHTLGGVHAQFHPELTNQPMAAFDSTRTVFDNAVAVEWINGSSKNPLALPVGAGALGTSSDANIYNSDGNVTMSRLASSKKAFDDACSHVFSRMFNEAIPKETVLSDIVAPYPVTAGFDSKLINELFHLRIGTIRLWKMAGTYKNVTLDYYRRDGTLGDRADLNVKPSKTLMNGLLETWDFTTGNKPIDPVTG
ncbi:heme peroxidase [Entophlyctis helioformis]|nr:heme peroxidase [Entophlyctis helioformis]